MNDIITNAATDLGAKDRILEAAIDLFAEKGYASASVREIVAHAGVTKPVLYYHFGNKEGLLKSIIDYIYRIQSEVIRDVTASGGSAYDKLCMLGRRLVESAGEHRNLVKVMCSLTIGTPQCSPGMDLSGLLNQFGDVIAQIHREGVRNGEMVPVDPELVLFLFIGLLDATMVLEYTGLKFDRSERIRDLIELAYKGLELREKKS